MDISSITGIEYSYSVSTVESNPADIAISQGMEGQVRGYNQGSKNGQTGQDVIQTADGALSGISDSLQRMRELAVQASSSALYSNSDRKAMQEEINQLKEHISDVAKYTQFNQKNLLDGSMADMHLATNPSGGGLSIHTTDATLESLGIADFDVTKNFDIKTLDDAIQRVSDARSSLGAQSSALGHSISVAHVSSENLNSSRSNLEDMDVAQQLNEQKKEQVMQQYEYFLQNQKMTQQKDTLSILLGN